MNMQGAPCSSSSHATHRQHSQLAPCGRVLLQPKHSNARRMRGQRNSIAPPPSALSETRPPYVSGVVKLRAGHEHFSVNIRLSSHLFFSLLRARARAHTHIHTHSHTHTHTHTHTHKHTHTHTHTHTLTHTHTHTHTHTLSLSLPLRFLAGLMTPTTCASLTLRCGMASSPRAPR